MMQQLYKFTCVYEMPLKVTIIEQTKKDIKVSFDIAAAVKHLEDIQKAKSVELSLGVRGWTKCGDKN